MALGRRLTEDSGESVKIDLSPMIDCVFILLIFFIVTTVFVEESGIDVKRPDVGPTNIQNDDNKIIELVINAQGVVKYNGRDIGVQGVKGLVKQERVNNPKIPVIIRADDKTPHQVFAEVYGEARLGGAEEISFK